MRTDTTHTTNGFDAPRVRKDGGQISFLPVVHPRPSAPLPHLN
jgi:hypothetical protein